MHTHRARFIGRGRDNAAPGVIAQPRELPQDRPAGRIDCLHRLVPASTANDDGPTPQLRVAQQLDRRIERVHVKMRDQALGHAGSRDDGLGSPRQCTRRKVRVALAVLAEAPVLMRHASGPPRIAGCALPPTRSSANRSRQQGAVARLA